MNEVPMTALTNSKVNQTDARRQIPWLNVRFLKKAGRLVLLYFLAGLVALICLIPIIWMAKTSFETTQFMRSSQIQFWPIKPTLANYLNVLNNPNAAIGRSMLNSLIVSTLATLLNLAITATAAYAMSRFKFRGKIIFAMYLLVFYMIPGTLVLIGMFVMLARLHLINNWIGLILIYAVGGIPLSTWWLKGYFDSIPIEIEESAMVDGCNRLDALWKVVLPLAVPGVVAVGIFQFVGSWNEFMMALTIIQNPKLQLLPVQIVNFMGAQRIEWGPVMAFSVIVAIPAVILFAVAQRGIVNGMMSGFTR
jgi:ABC-type glycerol-3-phosphate transport system permease component